MRSGVATTTTTTAVQSGHQDPESFGGTRFPVFPAGTDPSGAQRLGNTVTTKVTPEYSEKIHSRLQPTTVFTPTTATTLPMIPSHSVPFHSHSPLVVDGLPVKDRLIRADRTSHYHRLEFERGTYSPMDTKVRYYEEIPDPSNPTRVVGRGSSNFREHLVEIEKPVIQHTIVQVPDVEVIENIVEVPQTIVKEQIREIPRAEIQEHITYKPKTIVREKVEEIPEIEIVDVLVEKTVEIPEMREQVIVKEIPVSRYVECPVAEYVDVEVIEDIQRNVPIPVQCESTVEYKIPQIVSRYKRVPVPIYAPRFVEVAVPVEQMDEDTMMTSNRLLQEIAAVCSEQYPSLCDLEATGARAKSFHPVLCTDSQRIQEAWRLAVLDKIHGFPQTEVAAHTVPSSTPIDPKLLESSTLCAEPTRSSPLIAAACHKSVPPCFTSIT